MNGRRLIFIYQLAVGRQNVVDHAEVAVVRSTPFEGQDVDHRVERRAIFLLEGEFKPALAAFLEDAHPVLIVLTDVPDERAPAKAEKLGAVTAEELAI